MSAEDSFETLELAVDDHYRTVELFEEAVDDAAMGREVLTQLIDITQEYEEFRESTATVNTAIASYLMDHRDHMDARAVELKNDHDRLEEVIENYSPDGATGGGSSDEIDINITFEDDRRGFLKTVAAGGALLAGGGLAYGTWQNSGDDIYIAEENIGETPGDYTQDVASSEVIEKYVSNMMDEEAFSDTFTEVGQDIDGKDLSMGYMDSENRIDFYGDQVVSSVEMEDQLYNEAKDELNEVLQN